MKRFIVTLFVSTTFLFWAVPSATAASNCRCDRLDQRQERLEQRLDNIAARRDLIFANNPLDEENGVWLRPAPVLQRLYLLSLREEKVTERLTKVNGRIAKFC
jgi:hypothetical protein